MKFLNSLSRFFGRTFAIWVILFATLAFYFPAYFKVLLPYVSLMLGIVMFGMGLTLKAQDFSEVFRQPGTVLLGTLCQFILMPGIAWLLCLVFNLDKELAVGVILVGCCPGGTASNVMTYLAKGDVAPLRHHHFRFHDSCSRCHTGSDLFTCSQWVDIQPAAMCWSICQIVILPIVLGLLVRCHIQRQDQYSGIRSSDNFRLRNCGNRFRSCCRLSAENRRIRHADFLHRCASQPFGFGNRDISWPSFLVGI